MEKIKNANKTKTKAKLIHIEILRILSIFLVIFNHTGTKGFFLFSEYPFATKPYFIYMTLAVVCKIAVPLFLMISGALILKKDISMSKLFKSKILKLLIVLLVFSAVFYIRLHILKYSDTFTTKDFFIRLYKGDIIVPYWYLYVYISFLLSYPFLRAIVKSLPEYGYVYLIILSLIFVSVLPWVEYRASAGKVTLNEYGKVSWLFSIIVIYPLIGYYLENVIDIEKINKKHFIPMFLFAVFGILVSCYMTYFKHRITGICREAKTQDFLNLFALPISIFVYLSAKKIFYKKDFNKFITAPILSVGSCTFGIYLIHIAILESTFLTNFYTDLIEKYNFFYIAAVLILCLLTMIISYVIVFILKKIPIIKKLL